MRQYFHKLLPLYTALSLPLSKHYPKASPSKLGRVRIRHQHARIRLILLRQQLDIILNIQHCPLGLVLGSRLEIQQQITLDSGHSIRLQPRVITRVQLRRDANEIRVRDHDVDMRRPVGVSPHDAEQLSGRTRGVDGVLCRLEAVEVEVALAVGAELAAEVVLGLVLRIVGVVLAVGAGLPHVEDGVGDARPGVGVEDGAVEVGELAVLGHVLDDAGAEVAEGGVGGPEGAEDGGGGGLGAGVGDDGVVDLVDEARLCQKWIWKNRCKGTYDSMPRMSQTRHVSLRFVL